MAQILSRQAKPFPPLLSHMVIVLLQSLIHRKKVFLKQFMNSFILMVSSVCSLFSHSTKSAPLFRDLSGRTGQHHPSSAPLCVLPHPLQNRVPRVQVLLPLPKTALLLLQWRCFLSLGGTSWQRGTAAPRAVRVVGRVRASGTQATSRPRRQPRQVRPVIFS